VNCRLLQLSDIITFLRLSTVAHLAPFILPSNRMAPGI